MQKLAITLVLFSVLFCACQSQPEKQILGKWKLDSAYYHYNQFGFSSDGWHQEEVYEFLPSGEARTRAQHSQVSNAFEVKGNQLSYFDEQGTLINTYEILAINRNHLVLRAEKEPLFKGGNQNRFEVRYFSRFD
ncbi:hypothetical protein [Cyclobacterium plantarum]|uniref:Lipocalin-like domain-containing protein n=1 Tax=Cyclobacterium plantarum TaxID=2716263 RepID=A0ABX0H4G8_9BACT|nr:hypothetical protein [Cyclobacterium plantarum]NHE56320.1 hypothetical protein [Cyclobacterium plantarum]